MELKEEEDEEEKKYSKHGAPTEMQPCCVLQRTEEIPE